MGSSVDLRSLPLTSLTTRAMAAFRYLSLAVLVLVSATLGNPVKRSPDAMSLADGNAEPISAHDGFYGNPLYRPYGFGAWGYGSQGYMKNHLIIPNVYGGYYFAG